MYHTTPTSDDLAKAIQEKQLFLAFQPQVDLQHAPQQDLMIGVEALVRWQHPERGANIEKVDEIREVIKILNKNEFTVRIRKTTAWKDADSHKVTLLDIFEATAPNLQVENSLSEMSKNLALHIKQSTEFYKRWPIGSNRITNWAADLAALDLIEPSKKKHSVHDKEEYWSLTKLGKQVLKKSRRIILEEGLASDDDDET